jgi:hypothetical protein
MGMYVVGDVAYQVSDVMLVPVTGSQREDQGKDAFNFFLSQQYVRIEMAFGLLQTKWCVLNRPLQVSLSTAAKDIEICARLHNFCLCKDYNTGVALDDVTVLNEIIRTQIDSPLDWGYLPTVKQLRKIPGTSHQGAPI